MTNDELIAVEVALCAKRALQMQEEDGRRMIERGWREEEQQGQKRGRKERAAS